MGGPGFKCKSSSFENLEEHYQELVSHFERWKFLSMRKGDTRF